MVLHSLIICFSCLTSLLSLQCGKLTQTCCSDTGNFFEAEKIKKLQNKNILMPPKHNYLICYWHPDRSKDKESSVLHWFCSLHDIKLCPSRFLWTDPCKCKKIDLNRWQILILLSFSSLSGSGVVGPAKFLSFWSDKAHHHLLRFWKSNLC